MYGGTAVSVIVRTKVFEYFEYFCTDYFYYAKNTYQRH